MRRLRAVMGLAALLLVATLPALSTGSPPPAFAGGSPGPAAYPVPPAQTTPFAQAVFNHPSTVDPDGNVDWWDIEDAEYYLLHLSTQAPEPTIQVSMYRMADYNMAEALVEAAYSGATVQVLLDGAAETEGCHAAGCVSSTFKQLERLNTIHQRPGQSGTWLKTCSGYGPDNPTPTPGAGNGCLGQGLNHNKFMLMSTGEWQFETMLSDVVVQTSSNDDPNQFLDAFNNALVIANRPAVYHDYQRYFAREAAAFDSTKASSKQLFTRRSGTTVDEPSLGGHDIETLSYPRAATDDPMVTALKSVSTAHRCANSRSAGSPAHTNIDLGMFAISGRSTALHELAHLAAAGCPIHIVYTNISRAAYRTLHQHNIHLQQLCTKVTKLGPDQPPTRYFVHSKYLLIAGTTRRLGRNRRIVYTGSANLGTGSLTDADNRDIRYVEPASNAPIFSAYETNLRQMTKLGADSHELGYACKASDD